MVHYDSMHIRYENEHCFMTREGFWRLSLSLSLSLSLAFYIYISLSLARSLALSQASSFWTACIYAALWARDIILLCE
jgi:hypothetical protein